MTIRKIGILTGGGDCPGINAVIRAVVRCGIHKYGWDVIGFRDGFSGLIKNDFINYNFDLVSGLLDKGGTVLGTTNRDNPFHFPSDTEGNITHSDMSSEAISNIAKNNLDALVVIGGDGTMTIANSFAKLGVPIIGVPKTIDNDIVGTDYTFGFHTAVDTATDAIDKLHDTAESHSRIMVLEVMGRHAGWIALTAGLSGGADIILLPELGYDYQVMLDSLNKRVSRGKKSNIVIVSEGVKGIDGKHISYHNVEESINPMRLGGIGHLVAKDLEQLSGIESRAVVLGHLQRGGRPNPYDRILSTRFGAAATEVIDSKNFGTMVAVAGKKIITRPLDQVANKQKLVPVEHELIRIGQAMDVCFGSC